jgi:hypothetical protein
MLFRVKLVYLCGLYDADKETQCVIHKLKLET